MSYEKKKAELQEIRSKESEARSEYLELSNRKSVIGAEVSRAYDHLIDMKAQRKAGKRAESEVTEAEKKYLKLKDEQAELAEKIEVAERVADTLKDEVNQAEREFKRHTTPYYEKELQPYFEDLKSALKTAQESIDSINAYQNMLQRDQVNKSALLRGISYKSKVVIRKENRGGSLEMKNFLTHNDL